MYIPASARTNASPLRWNRPARSVRKRRVQPWGAPLSLPTPGYELLVPIVAAAPLMAIALPPLPSPNGVLHFRLKFRLFRHCGQ